MFRFSFIIFSLLAISASVMAAERPLQLLFLGDQKNHKPALRFEILSPVMADRGIELTYTEDVHQLNAKSLQEYDGLVLYANIDTIRPDHAKALLDYVASGKAFVPIHCATYCFRNSPEVVALMGAQFKEHGRGEMTTQLAGVGHPITNGYETFTSWDETYVHHLHNETDRTVLEYRAGDLQADGNSREPWTWIRTHGKGRVFYTAWGHDQRTWNQTGFQNLIERGIRWACGAEGATTAGTATELPKAKTLPSDLKPFDYVDVGPEIPNYAAGRGETLNLMQSPAPSETSIQHIVTPEGFHVELFVDESMLKGKPIAMNWDELGRLWICETLDYPNELKDGGKGRDRIRILEDTDGDFRADTSTVFADKLSIPTAIAFHRGGAVVQNGIETLYLKDTIGDGKADVRKVLISNWTLGDTHGGVSNFRNGLDNWIWAMQGYNQSTPVINPEPTALAAGNETPTPGEPAASAVGSAKEIPSFRMGFFRFKLSQDDDPIVEQLEFIRSTTNNTWGLGISEEGLIFGSTANRQPSFFMPIANRYYERVKGWAPERLSMICDDHLFDPITDKVRQVDHHGGYTAAAGHALYTARNYPQAWWNRTAFVCGPTGKLVGTFVIERDGAGMKSDSPINLFASNDEWTAPIMAEVGPDGNVWVLDWYNYIVQHNPTPQGFETGKGRAYETKLRDKKYGRIYRVVPDSPPAVAEVAKTFGPHPTPQHLVEALNNPTMEVRLHAQRLLVERGGNKAVPALIALLQDKSTDPIGLNVGAIHALNTLHGLGELDATSGPVFDAVVNSLSHPSAGVRLNAIRVLPDSSESIAAVQKANLIADPDAQVVLATLLKFSDAPGGEAGAAISRAAANPELAKDRWLVDAMTSAGAMHAESFLTGVLEDESPLPPASMAAVQRIAEHLARSAPDKDTVATLLSAMDGARSETVSTVISGLSLGWPKDHVVALDSTRNEALRSVFAAASDTGKASLARLATSWSNDSLEKEIAPIIAGFISRLEDSKLVLADRIESAEELIAMDPARPSSADAIEAIIGPQSPPRLSVGLVQTLSKTKAPGLADRYRRINRTATPDLRANLVRVMLTRPELQTALIEAMEQSEIQIADLSIQQRGALSSNPSIEIRRKSRDLFAKGGVVVNNDRTKLVAAKLKLTERTGDTELGKAVFTKHCATCHVFKGEGKIVGPNLNGMSVHPKAELLTHILDPNRSVEANYRLYNVLTLDGLVVAGLLSAESLTTIEMVDAQGKRHTILREDIDELRPSKNSAMPEGFEQSIDDIGLVNLLEYLPQSDQFIPLGLESVANVSTTEGMFTRRDNDRERLVLPEYGLQTIDGIPFQLIDPNAKSANNACMLHGPLGAFAPQMPRTIRVRCKTAASRIHLLGGVAGWAAKSPGNGGVSMTVRLRYADGSTEDHPLISGQHIADYIGQFDVPQSSRALIARDGGQVRYLSITPKRKAVIDAIEFVKANHNTAPLIFAVTVEQPGDHVSHQPATSDAGSTIKRNYGDKPNILFIAIDDLNDHVGYLSGYPGVITPNFDRLAAMGTAFTNAHCAAPICNPSRTSIMFGVRPSTSGVYTNAEQYRNSPALANAQTLPEYLRKHQGYSATGAGKIFHSLEWMGGISDGQNDPESWDSYWPTMTRQMPHRVMPNNAPLGRSKSPAQQRGVPPHMDWGPIGHPVESMPDYKVASHISEQLSGDFDKPFFLACGIFRPHIPFYVPQKYLDLYPLDQVRLPDNPEGWLDRLPESVRDNNAAGAARRKWHQWIAANGQWKNAVQAYLASVTFADEQLGRVLDALESSSHKDNTIVVLWSDHGAHLGDKETWEKYTLWHESTRVPLIFVAPGVTRPATVSDQPASLLDVYPTLLELAGIDHPGDQLEGTSLVPQLKNPQVAKDPVVCTHQLGNHAVISSTHRYIRYANGDEELYDLNADPAEWNNVADQQAYATIKTELSKSLPSVNFRMRPPAAQSKPVAKQKPGPRRKRNEQPR
ncbi:MAG: PVC-type heme-binding CxxCH protein [Rubripirellula sp.]